MQRLCCLLLAFFLFASCSSSVEPSEVSIVGDWNVVALDDTASTQVTYMRITADSIVLHQSGTELCRLHHTYTRRANSIYAHVTLNECGSVIPSPVDLEGE